MFINFISVSLRGKTKPQKKTLFFTVVCCVGIEIYHTVAFGRAQASY